MQLLIVARGKIIMKILKNFLLKFWFRFRSSRSGKRVKSQGNFTNLFAMGEIMAVGSSIYKFGLSVGLFVCLYPINVKTAEPIGPKFFVGHHVTPWKVYEWSKLKNLCLNFFIFVNFFKIPLWIWHCHLCMKLRDFFYKIREIFFIFVFNVYNENIFTTEIDGREAP